MTVDVFRESCCGAPFDEDEMAEAASEVVDDAALSTAATSLLVAKREFAQQLERLGVEYG